MGVRTLGYIPNGPDTSRGPSAAIWGRFDVEDFIQDFGGNMGGSGILFEDDFTKLPYSLTTGAESNFGQWDAWIGSSQTLFDAKEEGGVVKMDGASANKATTLSSRASSFRMVGASSNYNLVGGKFAMEFRIALGSIAASQQGVFIGIGGVPSTTAISTSDTTVQASGGNTLMTTFNLFGFFNRTTTSPADWSVVYQPPSPGTAVYPNGLTTLVNTVTGANQVAYAASTDVGKGTGFVKIGMVFDPTPSCPQLYAPATCPANQTAGSLYKATVQFFVNGVPAPAFLNSTKDLQVSTFPTNCVWTPVINYMNIAGSTAPIYLDWVRYGQVASF